MKLIFCPTCQDVFKLRSELRYCECGKSWGHYKGDQLNSEINDHAIPLGFNNHLLHKALESRPERSRQELRCIRYSCPLYYDRCAL